MLAGIVVVYHLHLRNQKEEVYPIPGARAHAQSTLDHAAYLVWDRSPISFSNGNTDPPILPSPAWVWYMISVVLAN